MSLMYFRLYITLTLLGYLFGNRPIGGGAK
jgi:hypothetical protein